MSRRQQALQHKADNYLQTTLSSYRLQTFHSSVNWYNNQYTSNSCQTHSILVLFWNFLMMKPTLCTLIIFLEVLCMVIITCRYSMFNVMSPLTKTDRSKLKLKKKQQQQQQLTIVSGTWNVPHVLTVAVCILWLDFNAGMTWFGNLCHTGVYHLMNKCKCSQHCTPSLDKCTTVI